MARAILDGGDARLRLSRDIFVPAQTEPGMGKLESALDLIIAARPANQKLAAARRDGRVAATPQATLIDRAFSAGIIDAAEAEAARAAARAQDNAIQVDAFPPAKYVQLK